MIVDGQTSCPQCGGKIQYYDSVERILRTKRRVSFKVKIRRLRCVNCGAVHRELPKYILPYKQYESEIIIGVCEGLITCESFGFEDYPCEMTMIRWKKSQELQLLLWRNP